MYTRNLTAALGPDLTARGDTLVVGLARRDAAPRSAKPGRRIRIFTPSHHPLERWTLPLEWARARCQLVHSPDFIPVSPGPWRTVITVHDLDFLRHPERLTEDARRYYGRIHWAVQRAHAIIAVSAATQKEILCLTRADPARITVIHEAPDPCFRNVVANRQPPAELSVGNLTVPVPYFLFVGTVEPRKNLDTLLDAYAAYRQIHTAPHGLVIAGAEGWNSGGTVARLKREPGITWLGGVGPHDLAALYCRATALVMPSWDEGFGLPVVEAMMCGTPVAISTAAALVEVAGGAALTAPASDERAWVAAMSALTDDPALRASLHTRGIQRAATFSWERAARETADLYNRVLAEPRRLLRGREMRAS